MNEEIKQDLFNTKETAQRLGISKATLWRWTKKGIITPIVINNHNRFTNEEIEKILNK